MTEEEAIYNHKVYKARDRPTKEGDPEAQELEAEAEHIIETHPGY